MKAWTMNHGQHVVPPNRVLGGSQTEDRPNLWQFCKKWLLAGLKLAYGWILPDFDDHNHLMRSVKNRFLEWFKGTVFTCSWILIDGYDHQIKWNLGICNWHLVAGVDSAIWFGLDQISILLWINCSCCVNKIQFWFNSVKAFTWHFSLKVQRETG